MQKKIEYNLNNEYITLTNLLKINDLVSSGGHAKILIQSGFIKLNNAICTQRGKKIIKGDLVECKIEEENILIAIN